MAIIHQESETKENVEEMDLRLWNEAAATINTTPHLDLQPYRLETKPTRSKLLRKLVANALLLLCTFTLNNHKSRPRNNKQDENGNANQTEVGYWSNSLTRFIWSQTFLFSSLDAMSSEAADPNLQINTQHHLTDNGGNWSLREFFARKDSK